MVVFELPDLEIILDDDDANPELNAGAYCISVDSIAISANVDGSPATLGSYSLLFGSGIDDGISNDGLAMLYPGQIGIQDTLVVSDTVVLNYTNPITTCANVEKE